MVDFYGKLVGKYTSPMDSMGYTGCFIGILIMAFNNSQIAGFCNPLYNLDNQGFFTAI